jgi:hypothetical protein
MKTFTLRADTPKQVFDIVTERTGTLIPGTIIQVVPRTWMDWLLRRPWLWQVQIPENEADAASLGCRWYKAKPQLKTGDGETAWSKLE